MKKITSLLMLLFLIQAHIVQATDWSVQVISANDSYQLEEEAFFDIEVLKNGVLADDKHFIMKSSFPDSTTAVSLVKIDKGKYVFSVLLSALLENQVLNVQVIKIAKKPSLFAAGFKTINVKIQHDNSFIIKEGSHTVNNQITLEIKSASFYEMAISEDPTFWNCQWQPYSASISYDLSNGDGEKTIYVKFRHKFTQEEQVENARIILDTIAPEFSALSPVDGSVVAGRTN